MGESAPATPEEIEMVERLLKRTRPAENVVPPPKLRPVPKTSTEVLALPVMLLVSPIPRTRAQSPKGKLLRVPIVALERMLEETRPTPRDST